MRRSPLTSLLAVALLGAVVLAGLLGTPIARAEWPAGGLVLSDTTRFRGSQHPWLVAHDDGGVYVVWANYTYEDPDYVGEIHTQRVTVDGESAPGWPHPDGLMLARTREARDPRAIATDAGGGVYVLWEDWRDRNYDIYGSRALASGAIAPGWPADGLPIANTTSFERLPFLFADADGAAFVAWRSGQSDARPRMSRLLPDGSFDPQWPAGGLTIDVGSGGYSPGGLFDDGYGRCFVNFGGTVGGQSAQFATRLASDGSVVPGWPADYVSLLPPGSLRYGGPVIADGFGGFYLVWLDFRTYPGPPALQDDWFDLYGMHWLADGTPDPRWPADGLPIAVAPLKQWDVKLVLAENRDLWAVWRDQRAYALGTGTAQDIYAQRVRPDGTLAPGFPANGRPVVQSWDADENANPVTDGADGLWLTFQFQSQFSNGIQHVMPDGTPDPEYGLDGEPVRAGEVGGSFPIIAWDGYRGAYVAWSEYYRPGYGPGWQVFLKRFGPPVPTAAAVTLMSSEATPEGVSLVWQVVEVARVTIERRAEGGEWQALATVLADGTGRIAYEDRDVMAGTRYGYRLAYDDGRDTARSVETWVAVPSRYELALAGFRPNPATRGDLTVAFTLPVQAPGSLELLDVAGRRVTTRDLSSFGAGRHALRLDDGGSPRAGVYWLRLSHAGRALTARGVVMR